MLGHLLTLIFGIVVGAVAVVVIAPSVLSSRARTIAFAGLLTLAVGCFVVAVSAKNPREARPRTLILHHHYVTSDESAPGRALPAALAVIALIVAVIVLKRSRTESPPLFSGSATFALATGIVAARFVVEKCAASESVAAAFGVLWLAPALGIRSALLAPTASILESFARTFGFAMLLRTPIIAANLLTTGFDLGSHFSLVRIERFQIPYLDARIFCDTLDPRQLLVLVLLPQMVLWPVAMALVAMGSRRVFERYQRWKAG